MSELITFLNTHRRVNDGEITHTRIKNEGLNIKGGSYTINADKLEKFYKVYYKSVIKTGNKEYITEKQQQNNGPICIDFDFRYNIDVKKRQHTKDDIDTYIDIILQILKKLFDFDTTPFKIFIFEKDKINISEKDNLTKDGLHIIIGINAMTEIKVLLREHFINEITNISKLPLIVDWHKVYDEGVSKGHTNWQMYGSCKPGYDRYKLKYLTEITYDNTMNDFDFEELNAPSNDEMEFDLFCQLSVQYKNHPTFKNSSTIIAQIEAMKQNKICVDKKKKSKLNISKKNKCVIDICDVKTREQLDGLIEEFLNELRDDEYEIKECHDYTMILPEKYYGEGSYDKWISVGWALKTTSEKLLLSWLKMSSKSSSFSFNSVGELMDMWEKFDVDGGLTKRSIHYWAQEDASREDYQTVKNNTMDYYIYQTLNTKKPITEFDMALVVHQYYKDKYICISVKNNIWYEFLDHKWKEIDSGNTLRLSMSKDIYQLYLNKLNDVVPNTESEEEYDEMISKKTQEKVKRITEINANLRKTMYKNNIMREARELFYDSNFLNNQDKNPYLMCFKNGVYDFKTNKFRKGRADDYITKSTNINYITSEECDKSIIKEIKTFMEQLFPKEELRSYMWNHLGSTLIGTNENQTFNIYTGSGRNGKSKLVELMSISLGDYKGTVPITLVTQVRRGIGASSSEIVQLQGIRYAVMQEPSKGDKINEGIMKELTGGDPIQGRALFKDTVTFIPQFKLVACANTLFDIASNDEGTWRRIRVCDFMSKFMEEELITEDEEEPYQFIVDKKLDTKFPKWKEVFISMLVDIVIKSNGIVQDCPMVMTKSGEYRSSQDYLAGYVTERLEKTTDQSKYIVWSELQEDFKDWYIQLYGMKVPKGQELKEYMTKKYGKPQRVMEGNTNKQAWLGLTLSSYGESDNFMP